MGKKYFLCTALGFSATVLQICSYKYNSWGKWKRQENPYKICLPLPPPLGCKPSRMGTVEVIDKDTNYFKYLVLLSAFISFAACIMVILLAKKLLLDIMGSQKAKRVPSYLFLLAAIANVTACIIATFQMNLLMGKSPSYKSWLTASSFVPAVSSSYYLSGLASILLFACSSISISFSGEMKITKPKTTKTIKQHMSRDLMYPNDKHNRKMITFSSMSSNMEEVAAEISVRASSKFVMEEDIAEYIKKEFEVAFGPVWHCIVGINFGSAVQHLSNEYIEIALPNQSVLLFRAGACLEEKCK